MKNLLCFAIAIGVCPAFSITSHAQISGSGAGFAIPDDDPAGASSTITISADELITDAEFSLTGSDHTWVGDLIVQVTSPQGTTVNLFNRPGDGGAGGFGSSSDLGADQVYNFSDDGENFIDAAIGAGGGVITGGDFFATGADDTQEFLNAAFAGESSQGDWTLFVSDNAAGDTGNIGGWTLSLNATAIPEPGSAVMLAILGAIGICRRRR